MEIVYSQRFTADVIEGFDRLVVVVCYRLQEQEA